MRGTLETSMASFAKTGTIKHLQEVVDEIYSFPNDRFYSLWDLLTQEQRFAMRTLKGIRKENLETVKLNLSISISWLCSISNRLHIDIEEELWKRFPGICPYCAKKPCACKKIKPTSRKQVPAPKKLKPKSLSEFQEMFRSVYPPSSRTLADAGIHFAEEVGEVSEAIQNYLGRHTAAQFDEIPLEIADLVSNMFGIANSAGIDLSKELAVMFKKNCHICLSAPCVCSYTFVANFK